MEERVNEGAVCALYVGEVRVFIDRAGLGNARTVIGRSS